MYWYPDRDFIIRIHDEMIREFGGHHGFERGINLFDVVVKWVKETRGSLYRKAAVFLKSSVNVRIFADGNHRTAFEVTDVFLRMNGGQIKITDEQKVIRFIKDIKNYSIEEIEAWLRHGEAP